MDSRIKLLLIRNSDFLYEKRSHRSRYTPERVFFAEPKDAVGMKKLHLVIAAVLAIVLVVAGVLAVCVFYVQPTTYQARHLDIMKACSDPSKKVIVRSWFLRDYNFTELYDWVHENLDFVPFNESFPEEQRPEDPVEIKESGRGRCGEFSILYVAACLAHGYECRLIAATEFGFLSWSDVHAWAEVRLDGRWVHVDPSERRWDEPQMYGQWGWGKEIGLKVRIFAFDDDMSEDVTQDYV